MLKLLAPYLAVGVFWCGFENAWLTILAYHAQIVFWSRGSLKRSDWSTHRRTVFWAQPAVAAGPLLFLLLPYITHTELTAWLSRFYLSGVSLLLMIPYFGLFHPILEQAHWRPLRERGWILHVAFAGYHMLVLYSLVTLPWLLACFLVLVAASWSWRWMSRRCGGLFVATTSHILADLGIVIVVWVKTTMIV